jgi:hypothetical protein
MTPDLLERLTPHLTVFHEGDPDPGLASREIIQALHLVLGTQELAPSPRSATPPIAVTATATRADGTRFTRRATVASAKARRDGRTGSTPGTGAGVGGDVSGCRSAGRRAAAIGTAGAEVVGRPLREEGLR